MKVSREGREVDVGKFFGWSYFAPFEVFARHNKKLTQRILGKGEFRHGFSADEMFLNDAFQHSRRATVIPNAFGINDRDGAARADAQATSFAAKHERVGTDEVQFFEALLEKFPRGEGLFARATLGFVRVGAEKDMALEFFQA
jgi:hypothetical protein